MYRSQRNGWNKRCRWCHSKFEQMKEPETHHLRCRQRSLKVPLDKQVCYTCNGYGRVESGYYPYQADYPECGGDGISNIHKIDDKIYVYNILDAFMEESRKKIEHYVKEKHQEVRGEKFNELWNEFLTELRWRISE